MGDLGKTLMFFLIQLTFSGSQTKKIVGEKWQIILPVTKFFTNNFFYWKNCMSAFPGTWLSGPGHYAKTVPFLKIFTPGNYVKFW